MPASALLAQQTLMARCSWEDPGAPATGGGTYWADGWDGYPAARRRLLATVADQRVPGVVVVLGGDVHANYMPDLKLDFNDLRAAHVASAICGTSISSLGLEQPTDSVLAFNPHLHHARSDQRGYVRLTLQRGQLQVTLRVLDDARRPDAAIGRQGQFFVDARRAGIQRGCAQWRQHMSKPARRKPAGRVDSAHADP